MGEQADDGTTLAPWEIPPDESYWRALLMEGEFGTGAEDEVQAPQAARSTISAEEPPVPGGDPEIEHPAPAAAPAHTPPEEAVSEPPPEPAGDDASIWDTFRAYQDEDREIALVVVGYNRGGLLVRWAGVDGFVPASQLCDGVASGDEAARQEAFDDQVGGTLTLKVIEVDANRGRLILSERAAQRELRTLLGY